MHPAERDDINPLASLTPRESELLRKAGERVFSLSRRLAEKEREADRLRAETQSLRDLLAESREVRDVLAAQVTSLQTEIEREYEERSELRRLLASLHVQMQELLPVVTGLSRLNQAAAAAPVQDASPAPAPPYASSRAADPRARQGFAGRLLSAAQSEFRGFKGNQTRRRR